MSFSTAEITTLDKVFRRSQYKIDQDVRWGDLCNIKNEGDQVLLYVHRPLGYAGLITLIGVGISLIVIGLPMAGLIKWGVVALIVLAIPVVIEFQPKRAISFYTDAEHKRLVFKIAQVKADKLLSRFFEVRGLQNDLAATIKNDISMGREKLWNVYRPSQELWVRVVRRIPWLEVLKYAVLNRILVMQRMKNHTFEILKKDSMKPLGEIDNAGQLTMQSDPEFTLDRRVALALAVVMRSV